MRHAVASPATAPGGRGGRLRWAGQEERGAEHIASCVNTAIQYVRMQPLHLKHRQHEEQWSLVTGTKRCLFVLSVGLNPSNVPKEEIVLAEMRTCAKQFSLRRDRARAYLRRPRPATANVPVAR
eukprot:scaffold159851_cov33-Tisochrysis_lutea.AAC.2